MRFLTGTGANFNGARIGGQAQFSRTIFKQDASFDSTQIEGLALFNPATFEGGANFNGARIGGQARFIEVIFKQEANFNGVRIEGTLALSPATFEGGRTLTALASEARLSLAGPSSSRTRALTALRLRGVLYLIPRPLKGGRTLTALASEARLGFIEVIFKQEANFNGVRIEGTLALSPATFEGRAHFNSACIGGSAAFNEAVFKQDIDFFRAQIKNAASFMSAIFEGDADLGGMQIEGGTFFSGTVFFKKVSFVNSLFKTISFGQPKTKTETQFKGRMIDLRGCIYDRIDPTSFWTELMNRLDPYDRQPFTQLEATFRRAGREDLGAEVYYTRRRRESKQLSLRGHPFTWLADRFLWALTGYGVQLRRLLIAIIVILLVGTAIFHLEGAVDPERDALASPLVQPQATPQKSLSLPWSKAFWVSLRIFLPAVTIPAGAAWKPSSNLIWAIQTRWGPWGIEFTTFATLLKLIASGQTSVTERGGVAQK